MSAAETRKSVSTLTFHILGPGWIRGARAREGAGGGGVCSPPRFVLDANQGQQDPERRRWCACTKRARRVLLRGTVVVVVVVVVGDARVLCHASGFVRPKGGPCLEIRWPAAAHGQHGNSYRVARARAVPCACVGAHAPVHRREAKTTGTQPMDLLRITGGKSPQHARAACLRTRGRPAAQQQQEASQWTY